MVLSKAWHYTKFTAETLRGATKVLISPNAPIPPTQLHPRMMAQPFTLQEWIRMSSWRHMWMYMPAIRLYIFGALMTGTTVLLFLPSAPRQAIKDQEAKAAHRKHEQDHHYGRVQKTADKEYFLKHDPLRHTRPDAAALVYGGGH